MKRIPFNVNNYIWVKLRPKGVELYLNRYKAIEAVMPALASSSDWHPGKEFDREYPGWRGGGWCRFQMWCFIELFGSPAHLGFQGFYETGIEFEVEDAKP